MTPTAKRTLPHKLAGLAALALFAVFMGNIVLAKLAMMRDFTAPRFSAQTEFLVMLVATLLAVIYLLQEERRRAQTPLASPGQTTNFQAEEEKR